MDKFVTRTAKPGQCPKRELEDKQEDPPKRARSGGIRSIMTWNCNGLVSRIRSAHDHREIKQLLELQQPDVICLQEVKLLAATAGGLQKGQGPGSRRYHAMDESDKRSRDEALDVRTAISSWGYKAHFSLNDRRFAGSAVLLRKHIYPRSVRYNLDPEARASVHYEGRVIVMEFDEFELIATYGVNNGWTKESFDRRREWDNLLLQYFTRKREMGTPVIWCGDMNVSHMECDVSHPRWFATRKGENAPRPADEENVGQPGFTIGERRRFSGILVAGDLVDAYRLLHPTPLDLDYTWRGTPPTELPMARYYGKGMRIDYFLVSSSLKDKVEAVEVCGYGKDRQGFMGSDHCPLILRLTFGRTSEDGGQDNHATSRVDVAPAEEGNEASQLEIKPDDTQMQMIQETSLPQAEVIVINDSTDDDQADDKS